MAGGLMQLVAYGAQDVYLTGRPQITFFKVVYRRHTNFATESVEQFFGSTADFGRKAVADIDRQGDLITQVILKLVTPEVRYNGPFEHIGHAQFGWTRNLGHAAVEETELEVGGSPIDRQYGDWLNIWNQVSGDHGHNDGIARMLGDDHDLTSISSLSWRDADNTLLKPSRTLYVPLQFYFCRFNGLALPLIALQYHTVKISVKFRPVDQLYIASDAFKSGHNNLHLEEASLYVNYIFLDTIERRLYAQSAHEYLIEQIQNTGEETIGNSTSGKFRLNFSHPVKAIYWITKLGNYQGGKFMVYDHCDWERAREAAAKLLLLSLFDLDDYGFFHRYDNQGDGVVQGDGNAVYDLIDPAHPQWSHLFINNDVTTDEKFNGSTHIGRLTHDTPLLALNRAGDLRDKVDGVIRIFTDPENDALSFPQVERITRNGLTIADLSIPINRFEHDNRNNFIKRFDVTVWQHNNYGLYIDGSENPNTDVELQLNGKPRQSKRSGTWHDTVVPWMHHNRTPSRGVNVFSFALNPEEHQPSSTCNFSRIDNAQLNLRFDHFANNPLGDVFTNTDNKVIIFSPNYNVLRFLSGMCGAAYSS